MVMTLRKRNRVVPIQSESESELKTKAKQQKTKSVDTDSESENEQVASGYEKFREERMRENRERMLKLGIFSLASQLFNPNNKTGKPSSKSKSRSRSKSKSKSKRKRTSTSKSTRFPPLYPRARESRRSDRLVKLGNGEYLESESFLKHMGISMPNTWESEVYTDEHVKLLGDCKTIWTLKQDGFNEDGDRLYDPNGTPCHHCRQKVLAKLTYCGKCRSPHGQLCGDCLYTRYGENVVEAIQNPSWLCPVCRAICNCSRCRRSKGWQPINIQHSQLLASGFKSVAHYLILTRRLGATPVDINQGIPTVDLTTDENEGSDYSAQSSESHSDTDDGSQHHNYNNQQSLRVQAQPGLTHVITTVEETTTPQQNAHDASEAAFAADKHQSEELVLAAHKDQSNEVAFPADKQQSNEVAVAAVYRV